MTPDDLLDGIVWEPIVSVTGGLSVSPRRAVTRMSEEGTDHVVAERIAANLRRLRAAAGIGREELALLAEIDPIQVCRFESGRDVPRAKALIKLAGALGVTTDDLVDGITWDPSRGFGVSEGEEEPGA